MTDEEHSTSSGKEVTGNCYCCGKLIVYKQNKKHINRCISAVLASHISLHALHMYSIYVTWYNDIVGTKSY